MYRKKSSQNVVWGLSGNSENQEVREQLERTLGFDFRLVWDDSRI